MPRLLDRTGLIDTYQPSRGGVLSAWYGHVPFGNWLTATTRPNVVVELGTHNGVSFASFCDAVITHDIPAVCYAVDTWAGDPQAGLYGEEVWADWSRYSEEHYGRFAHLLRGTFDEALEQFADGSVDLLHIDGLHTYDAVKHDFDSWLPKLSARGVIIMHDIGERQTDFGVWRLWAEIQKAHPTFEFLHEHGLGVVAVGPDAPEAVRMLVSADEAETLEWRSRFAAAGDRVKLEEANTQLSAQYAALAAAHAPLAGDVAGLNAEVARLQTELGRLDSQVGARDGELRDVRTSTSWRVTAPLRAASRAVSRVTGRPRG